MTHDDLQNNSSDTGTKVPMTHDELLEKIDDALTHFDFNFLNALRAVVELHKPEKMIIKGLKTEYWCLADNNEPTPYPCPTILQIEKELK